MATPSSDLAGGVIRTFSFSNKVYDAYRMQQADGANTFSQSGLSVLILVLLLALGFRLGQSYVRYIMRAVREDALAEELATFKDQKAGTLRENNMPSVQSL